MDTKVGKEGWNELGNWDGHIYITMYDSVAQGTLPNALWWIESYVYIYPQEENWKRSGYVYTYDSFTLLYNKILIQHCKASISQ